MMMVIKVWGMGRTLLDLIEMGGKLRSTVDGCCDGLV